MYIGSAGHSLKGELGGGATRALVVAVFGTRGALRSDTVGTFTLFHVTTLAVRGGWSFHCSFPKSVTVRAFPALVISVQPMGYVTFHTLGVAVLGTLGALRRHAVDTRTLLVNATIVVIHHGAFEYKNFTEAVTVRVPFTFPRCCEECEAFVFIHKMIVGTFFTAGCSI